MSGTQNDDYDLRLQRKQEELEQLGRQTSRIVDAVAKLSDSEALLSKLKNLEKEQKKVRQELIELETNKPMKIRLEDLDQLSAQLKARFDDATDRTKQLILRSPNSR